MTLAPIEAIGGVASPALEIQPRATSTVGGSNAFTRMLLDGVEETNRKVVDANALVRAFALDDSVPLHQVTYALEQARLSVELMMQVRARLVEGYQDIMRMQL